MVGRGKKRPCKWRTICTASAASHDEMVTRISAGVWLDNTYMPNGYTLPSEVDAFNQRTMIESIDGTLARRYNLVK